MDAGLPNITGTLKTIGSGSVGLYLQNSTGAFANPNDIVSGQLSSMQGGTTCRNANFNASWSNSIYNKSSTVTPLSLSYIPIIKY